VLLASEAVPAKRGGEVAEARALLRHKTGSVHTREKERSMRGLRFVVVAVIAGWFLQGQPALAQRSVATYTKEAIDSLSHLLDKAAKDGFTMEARTTTMFGGWMPVGKKTGSEQWVSILVATKLDPDRQYRVIAAGDNDTIDLDLRILDPSGAVVVEDNAVTREPAVTFRPTRRQDYTIQMRLYDSRDNCVCIGAILTK
jgi:hypothetical protein